MWRATCDGGRVAVTVWSPLERSPHMAPQHRAHEAVIGPEASASFLDAFSCHLDSIAASFGAAGLGDIEVREVLADIQLGSAEVFVRGHLAALPWAGALVDAQPNVVETAAASMMTALAADIDADGSLAARFASRLVSGIR
jgi:hypothetical protein